MNGSEVLRIVDAIHRDKNIDKEIVFEGIEQAILSAARKHFGEDHELTVTIDRENGEPTLICDGEVQDKDVLGHILGRIAAQTAKQVMIQKIREAERDALFDEYTELKSQIVTGTTTRVDGGALTVNLGKVEGILPRSEQIPGESHRVGERLRAVVLDVRKAGSRVKIILSRTHPDLVRRLFEIEIPEVAERIIEVRSLAREAGYRSKVAVSCIDSNIDCVGACVGVRGSRIKSIMEELASERIDIVRWNDSLQVLVPNGLQPAEVEDVILCPMLGRVLVLVRDDQLSIAIGKRGQNVRLASKLVGWDIEVMTREELDEQLDRSVEAFGSIEGVSDELAESLVAQGFFSFYDLSVIEPDQLAELGSLTAEQCDSIIAYADAESIRLEEEEERRRREGPPPAPPAEKAEHAEEEDEAVSDETASSDEAETEASDGGESPSESEATSAADDEAAPVVSEDSDASEEPEAQASDDDQPGEAGEMTQQDANWSEQQAESETDVESSTEVEANHAANDEQADGVENGSEKSLKRAEASATDE